MAVPIQKSRITLKAQYLATKVSAESGLRTVIKPSQRKLWKVFQVDTQSYVQIRGFEIDGTGSGDGDVVNGAWPAGIEIVNESHHITIADNIVHDLDGAGIYTYNDQVGAGNPGGAGGADYVTIERNTVYNTCFWSKYDTSAISVYGLSKSDDAPDFHNVVRGNLLFGNISKYTGISKFGTETHTDGNGIIFDLNGTSAPLSLVENNVVYDNGGRGIHSYKSSNVFVRNNTVVNNCLDPDIKDGDLTAGQSRNVVFANNIAVSRSGGKATSTYNNTSGTITFTSNLYAVGTVAVMGTGDVRATDVSSLFVSMATSDYHPKAGSLAIDTGTVTPVRLNPGTTPALTFPAYAPLDYVGRKRYIGSAPDKGAYEYIAVGRR